MKTKTFGNYIYIVKTYYKRDEEKLEVIIEQWHNKSRAKWDYDRKVKIYGEDNVFVFKAKQCIFE